MRIGQSPGRASTCVAPSFSAVAPVDIRFSTRHNPFIDLSKPLETSSAPLVSIQVEQPLDR